MPHSCFLCICGKQSSCMTAEQCGHYSGITWTSWPLKSLATWLFAQKFDQANIKENIAVLHYWSFVRGIHRWPVDSPQKGPVMRKTFSCHDLVMCDPHMDSIGCFVINHAGTSSHIIEQMDISTWTFSMSVLLAMKIMSKGVQGCQPVRNFRILVRKWAFQYGSTDRGQKVRK